MSLRAFFRNQDGDFEELIDRIHWPDFELTMNAEEGSVAMSTVPIQDPDADLYVGGHRPIYFMETEVPDSDQRVIGYCFTGARRVRRTGGDAASFRTQASRVWNTEVSDLNALIHRRIQVGADAKRPAETDIERLQWLLDTTEAANFTNTTLFDTSDPVDMDENDYTGQRNYDVIGDCSQASGKNYYAKRFNDGTFGIVYQFAESDYDESEIKLTNDWDDVLEDEYGNTFIVEYEPNELNRDPERVYSGVGMAYDGGFQYRRRGQTAFDFAERDTTMPSPNVKTTAQARARILRYLSEIRREEDVITYSFLVPNARVNDLREGQRVQVRSTFMPGYEGPEFTWMRALNRTVKKVSSEFYRITVELSGEAPEGFTAPGDVLGILERCKNKEDEVWWSAEGVGALATSGPIEAMFFEGQYEPSHSYLGWKILGTGTVDVTICISSAGVLPGDEGSITLTLKRNADTIATDSYEWDFAEGSFLNGASSLQTFSVEGIEVEPDDELVVYWATTPELYMWGMPTGTGQNGERFEITGGTLV
jgi:hypothetical protein